MSNFSEKVKSETTTEAGKSTNQSIPETEIQGIIAGRTGKIRAACPACKKKDKHDETLDIDVQPDGTGVYNCHRCEIAGSIGKKHSLNTDSVPKPQYLYNAATDIFDHTYLSEKKIKIPKGVRKDRHGNLVIPLYDPAGNIQTIQMIRPEKPEDGKPRKFLCGKDRDGNGFPKKGASFQIGEQENSEIVYFCEGLANAASLDESGLSPAVMCVDAGNIAPVVASYRLKYPDRQFIIVADNDRDRPEISSSYDKGFRKATIAARKAGNTLVCLPPVPGQDVNDIFKAAGPEGVKALIETATPPEPAEKQSQKEAGAVPLAIPPDSLPERFMKIVMDAAGNDPESQVKIADAIKRTLKAARQKPKTADAISMLARAGWTFELRECDDRVLCNGAEITDKDTAKIYNWIRDNYIKLGREEIDSIITEAADRNAFHPVKRYLENLKWDGEQHIAALLTCLESDEPDIIYPDGRRARAINVFFKKWMVGAISKVYNHTQNPALVFVGDQGRGKSTLAKWLCSGLPEYFAEKNLLGNPTDLEGLLATSWIWEIGELDATTRKADVSFVKDFITKGIITTRLAYRRHPMRKPALASFIGTVNNDTGFLADSTGNRRFMCVNLTDINLDYSKLNINQLWAEAYHLFQVGFDSSLDATEKAYQNQENQKYMCEDSLDGLLHKYFVITKNEADFLSAGEIIEHINRESGVNTQISNRKTTTAISTFFKKMGVEKGHNKNRTVRGYNGIKKRFLSASAEAGHMDTWPDRCVREKYHENQHFGHMDILDTKLQETEKEETDTEKLKVGHTAKTENRKSCENSVHVSRSVQDVDFTCGNQPDTSMCPCVHVSSFNGDCRDCIHKNATVCRVTDRRFSATIQDFSSCELFRPKAGGNGNGAKQ